MKAFLSRASWFFGILVLITLAITLLVPATPRSRTSLLFAKLDKDRILINTPSPRLILMGGSNISMGIDSNLIKEELGVNPINTAIHATIGLEYIADNVIKYIQPGDVVIISLEYSQYFGSYMYGGEELLRMVMDVDRSTIRSLKLFQWLNIIRFVPKYAISKIKPSEYFYKEQIDIDVYERESFNQYGDAVIQWTKTAELVEPYPGIDKFYNPRAIKRLIVLDHQIREKGGELIVTYPAIQEATFLNMEEQITKVKNELNESGLVLLGSPEEYVVGDELLFDTPYHLTHSGALYRTQLLIDDLLSINIQGNQ